MSDSVIFDTHAFVKRGIDAGLTQREAEFFANEQVQLFEHNLATKTDIASLQKETAGIRKDIADLQKETAGIRKDITGLQTDIAGIHKDI
ncbi:MAG: hypothetical protein F4X01_07490, partial [Nitrospira sp. SB0661_bin_20]|nr:hypothetical protein [Nitrospira sp. SB0661_bin_20]